MGIRGRFLPQICVSVCLLLTSHFALSATRSGGPPRSSKSCNQILSKQSQKLPKIEPIILKPLKQLFDDPNYLFEMKYDGFRGIAYFDKDRGCRFMSRNGNRLSQFQPLCETILQQLKVKNAIFDGELISSDPSGRPIFSQLLRRKGPFSYIAFDLLWLNGKDLRPLPLEDRRRLLLKVLPKSSSHITDPLVVVGRGFDLYNLMVSRDLEGVVAKKLKDDYSRSTKWYKFVNRNYSQAAGRSRFFH